MRKFLVLYRSTLSNMEQLQQVPPDRRKAIMDAWATWARKAGTALVEKGAPGASIELFEVMSRPGA